MDTMNNDFNENRRDAVNDQAVQAETVNDSTQVNEEASTEEVKAEAEQVYTSTEIFEEAAPETLGEAPAPQKKLRKMVIAAVIALAVLIAASFTALAISNSPAVVAERALENALDDLLARDELAYFSSIFSGGSIDVEASGELDGAKLDGKGKIYLNDKAGELMIDGLELNITANNETRTLTGSIYSSNSASYVYNDEILGGTYGIKRGKLEEKLEDSIFNPESESEYALDEDSYKALRSICRRIDSGLSEELSGDVDKVAARYSRMIKKTIAKHAIFKSKNEKIELHTGEMSTRVVYVIITPEATANILKDIFEYIENDDKLRELVIEYYEEYAEILEFGENTDEDFDIEDEYYEFIDGLEESLDLTLESLDEEDDESFIALCIATPVMSSKAVKIWALEGEDIEYMFDEDEVTELFYVDFGKDGLKKTTEIVGKIGEDGGEIKYVVNTDEEGAIKYELKIGSVVSVFLDLDETNGDFELSFDLMTDEFFDEHLIYYAKGDYTVDGDKATFEVNKLRVNNVSIMGKGTEIIITFDKSDKMPTPKKNFSDVLDLSDDDVKEIVERFEEWSGMTEE